MYACATVDQPLRYLGMVWCRSLRDLRELIHEKEVLTGDRGRKFFSTPQFGPEICIAENPAGFDVAFGDSKPIFYSTEALVMSGIGKAMLEGRLFTNDV
jgi:hypothetical protein